MATMVWTFLIFSRLDLSITMKWGGNSIFAAGLPLSTFICPQIMLEYMNNFRRFDKQKDFQRIILYFLPNLCDLASSENWCLVLLCIAEDQMWVCPESPIGFCFFELPSHPRSSKCCRWGHSTLPVTSEFFICEPEQGHLHILL